MRNASSESSILGSWIQTLLLDEILVLSKCCYGDDVSSASSSSEVVDVLLLLFFLDFLTTDIISSNIPKASGLPLPLCRKVFYHCCLWFPNDSSSSKEVEDVETLSSIFIITFFLISGTSLFQGEVLFFVIFFVTLQDEGSMS